MASSSSSSSSSPSLRRVQPRALFSLCTLFGVVQFRGLALLCNLFVGGFSRAIVYVKVYIIHTHTHTRAHIVYIHNVEHITCFSFYVTVKLLSFADSVERPDRAEIRNSNSSFGLLCLGLFSVWLAIPSHSLRMCVCVCVSVYTLWKFYFWGVVFCQGSRGGFGRSRRKNWIFLNVS